MNDIDHAMLFCRVLKAPGGGSSNIFGHYQEQEEAETQRQRQFENSRVQQSLSQVSQCMQWASRS